MKKINILGLEHLNLTQEFFDKFDNEEELMRHFEDEHLKFFKESVRKNLQDGVPYEVCRLISKNMRYRVLSEQKWNCNNCGCKLVFNKNATYNGKMAHIDHIHPFADRDTYINGKYNINERENLQGLCSKCNLAKGRNKQ